MTRPSGRGFPRANLAIAVGDNRKRTAASAAAAMPAIDDKWVDCRLEAKGIQNTGTVDERVGVKHVAEQFQILFIARFAMTSGLA